MKNQTKPEPKCVAAALAWCNERRAEKGKKPRKKLPKGERRDPKSCPCGKAAGVFVGSESWGNDPFHYDNRLPRSVAKFVDDFDTGKLPQYDAELK